MLRLKKRADFLKTAKGGVVRMPAFLLQYIIAPEAEMRPRIGFTVTKRQGNAVTRNRIKRRLREAVRLAHAQNPFPPGDYVLVGRKESLDLSFALLQDHLGKAKERMQRLA